MSKCRHCGEESGAAHTNVAKIAWLIEQMIRDAEDRARKEARRERYPDLETKEDVVPEIIREKVGGLHLD